MSIVPIGALIPFLLTLNLQAKTEIEATPVPFWKKEPVYKTVVESRALAVSAKIDKVKKGSEELEHLQVMAAGHIAVPLSYAWKKVREFDHLPKVSSHFNKAEYYPDKKRLYLDVAALGYHAMMILQLRFEEHPEWKEIRWEVVEGGFHGMTGTIRLEDVEHKRTEMSLTSDHETKKLPLPASLKGFVIEVIGQRVAGLMREYIEDEYKKEGKK